VTGERPVQEERARVAHVQSPRRRRCEARGAGAVWVKLHGRGAWGEGRGDPAANAILAAYATAWGQAGGVGTLCDPMSLVKLSDAEIAAKLETLPEWSQPGEEIQRTYRFRDFVAAMAFVDEIAAHAEAVQHHPDILIRYSRVTLSLSTHDAGGITGKDFDFAAKADAIALASGVK